ncbi:MAG: glycosyltransferase family 4 protein [Bdellovibrionota bacterium]
MGKCNAAQISDGEVAPTCVVKKKQRVLLDARKIWDGGIGVYTQNLITGLSEVAEIELSILVPSKICNSAEFATYPWLDRVKVVVEDAKPYSLEEMFKLGKRITSDKYDLYHSPHYTLPLGIKIPTVVTIHDLIHIKHPEKVYYPFIATPLIVSALKRSSRVLTVSQSTLNDLKRLCPLPSVTRKLRLAPNAINPAFLAECKNPNEYLGNKFKLTSPYFLSVFSTLKPHKGINDLLQAFLALKKRSNAIGGAYAKACNDFKLVLVGQGMESLPSMDTLLEQVGGAKDVFVLGAVSTEDLLNLYSGATALVVPSLAEGFGLPVIEAQAQGTPVISRPIPSVLELLSKHDIACADFSKDALEAGLTTFIERYACGEYVDPLFDVADKMKRFNIAEIAKTISFVYEEAVLQKR